MHHVSSTVGVGSSGFEPHLFKELERAAEDSARHVLPLVFELFHPHSIVDVGCWTGSWLMVARQLGIPEVLGIDMPSTDSAKLKIPADCFLARDLSLPLRLDRSFDLAISLEVAEHLPEGSCDAFVGSLVSLAPAVLFSAAIPGQGGTGHVNEQWPEYWIARFKAHGWKMLDCVRAQVWQDERVAHYYAQNILLFVSPECPAGDARLAIDGPSFNGLPVVHPTTLQLAVGSPTLPPPEPARRRLHNLRSVLGAVRPRRHPDARS